MRVMIQRFESIPAGDPADYVVGFEYRLDNGRIFYLEDVIPIKDVAGKSDQEITAMAYLHLQDEAERRASELAALSALIGSEFVPPGGHAEEGKPRRRPQPRGEAAGSTPSRSMKVGASKAAERTAEQQATQAAAKE